MDKLQLASRVASAVGFRNILFLGVAGASFALDLYLKQPDAFKARFTYKRKQDHNRSATL